MNLTHAGYKDPNNLTFENITILGMSLPPKSIAMSTMSRNNGISTTVLKNTQYDPAKKVQNRHKTIKRNLLPRQFEMTEK